MIVADTSAWVEYLRRTGSSANRALRRLLENERDVAVTEVVVMEVLAGARSGQQRRALRQRLLSFPVLTVGGLDGYERAADLYRECRRRGVTPRGLLDCLVAGVVIRDGARLLAHDRDFAEMAAVSPLELYTTDEEG